MLHKMGPSHSLPRAGMMPARTRRESNLQMSKSKSSGRTRTKNPRRHSSASHLKSIPKLVSFCQPIWVRLQKEAYDASTRQPVRVKETPRCLMRRKSSLQKVLISSINVCLAGAFVSLFAGNGIAVGAFLSASVGMARYAYLHEKKPESERKGTG